MSQLPEDLEAGPESHRPSNEVEKMKLQIQKMSKGVSQSLVSIKKDIDKVSGQGVAHISHNLPDLTTSAGVIFTAILGCACHIGLVRLYTLIIPSSFISSQVWTTPEEFSNLLGCYMVGVVAGWKSTGPQRQLSWQQIVGMSLCSSLTSWSTTNYSLWEQALSWHYQTVGYFLGLIVLLAKSTLMFALGTISRPKDTQVVTAPSGTRTSQERNSVVDRTLQFIYSTSEDRDRGGAAMCVSAAVYIVFVVMLISIWAILTDGATPKGTTLLLSTCIAPFAAYLRLMLQSLWNYQMYPCPWGTLVANIMGVTLAVCAIEFSEAGTIARGVLWYGVASSLSTLSSIVMEVVPKLDGHDSFKETLWVYIYLGWTIGLTYVLLWV